MYGAYLTALQHVKEYRETVLPEARKAYEVMLDAYKADRVKWVDVLAVEKAYFARRATYIANLVVWRESEVLIVGYLLAGGLSPAAAPIPIPAAGPGGGGPPNMLGMPGGGPGQGASGPGADGGRMNPR